jgi:catalase
VIAGLRDAAAAEQVTVEFVAPAIGGITASDGAPIAIGQQVDGGPSVLYDAVVLLPSQAGAASLARIPAARDFVTDAYAHCKFIGCPAEAAPLLEATGLTGLADAGIVVLDSGHGPADFIAACRQLRFWERQLNS